MTLADVGGIRSTALALHRTITRRPSPDALRLVWLYGDDTVPTELHPRSTLLSRQSPDADLRAALEEIEAVADELAETEEVELIINIASKRVRIKNSLIISAH